MMQVVEMSYSEKVEMYNLVSKDKLIEMLIEANRHLSNIKPTVKLTIPVVSKSVTVKELKCPKCKKHSLIKFVDLKECTSCGYVC